MAIADDTVVVGAPGSPGAAYVFTEAGGTWIQTAELTTPDGTLLAFGESVAIDGNTVVVGAPFADLEGNDNQGVAYVFTEAAGTWIQTAKLIASNGAQDDAFGVDVAIDGHTIVVGQGDEGDPGSVYVFTRIGSAWTETMQLSGGGAYAGSSVAIDGNTVVVGTRWASPASTAYVFTRFFNVWIETATLVLPTSAPAIVAVAGDRIVVGQPHANSSQGAAYVFSRSGSTWTQTKTLTASDGAASDNFGESVAIDGNRVVVGAPYAESSSSGYDGPGAAYVFERKLLLFP